MEVLAFIAVSLVAFAIPLLALRFGREWLIALLPIYLITANVFAESFLFILGELTSLAIPVYAATFLITDTLSEHYGRTDARRAVILGFVGQVIFLAMTLLVVNSPILPDKATAFGSVFAILPRLIVGSFIAYLISQFWDIHIFHVIREKTGGGMKTLWIRNNISTVSSQLLDTVIFVTIAFYGNPQIPNLISFILFTWLFKLGVAFLDTPYLYLTYAVVGKGRPT